MFVPEVLMARDRKLKVAVVGAGGTGSHLLGGLRFLHAALAAYRNSGLDVTVFDPDTVGEFNLVRQDYFPSEVGHPKAVVLVNRLNARLNLGWKAEPVPFESRDHAPFDVVLSCVDSRQARWHLHQMSQRNSWHFWLDTGNDATLGQVILGQPFNALHGHLQHRLQTATEIHPELMDLTLPDDTAPSCGTLEALMRQDLFINQQVAGAALNLLWQILRHGVIHHQGVYLNLNTGTALPLKVEGLNLTS